MTDNQKGESVAQWQSTYLACMRSWVHAQYQIREPIKNAHPLSAPKTMTLACVFPCNEEIIFFSNSTTVLLTRVAVHRFFNLALNKLFSGY